MTVMAERAQMLVEDFERIAESTSNSTPTG